MISLLSKGLSRVFSSIAALVTTPKWLKSVYSINGFLNPRIRVMYNLKSSLQSGLPGRWTCTQRGLGLGFSAYRRLLKILNYLYVCVL